jgi:hypothetical protein
MRKQKKKEMILEKDFRDMIVALNDVEHLEVILKRKTSANALKGSSK